MPVRRRKRNPLTRFITPVATMMLLGYFGFHALNGSHGLRAQVGMNARAAVLSEELHDVRARREAIERRLFLLADGSMDRDMVDEQIRYRLAMARADEIIVQLD